MAVYTKTGDQGSTSLASGVRVPKTDMRIEAYGTVDELNSWVGMLRAGLQKLSGVSIPNSDEQLEWIQNRLFNLGAALSDAPGEWIIAEDVQQLEQWIDAMQAVVPKQHAFVLPAGSEPVCRCHICRTICRRAERKMIEMNVCKMSQIGSADPGSKTENFDLPFMNRLSDYFFVLSRFLGYKNDEKEAIWCKK